METNDSDTVNNTNTGGSVINKEITQIVKVKLKAEMSKNMLKNVNGERVLKGRRRVIYAPDVQEKIEQLNTCLNEAVFDFVANETSSLPFASLRTATMSKGSTTVPSKSTTLSGKCFLILYNSLCFFTSCSIRKCKYGHGKKNRVRDNC